MLPSRFEVLELGRFSGCVNGHVSEQITDISLDTQTY